MILASFIAKLCLPISLLNIPFSSMLDTDRHANIDITSGFTWFVRLIINRYIIFFHFILKEDMSELANAYCVASCLGCVHVRV